MDSDNRKLYNAYDRNWQRVYFDEMSQGFVVAHVEHGKDELAQNVEVAIRLVKHFGDCIELLPISYRKHDKSADAIRNGELWEWKTSSGSYSSVQKRLRVGSHQCGRVMLILPDFFETSYVLRGIISAVNSDRSQRLLQVAVFLPNSKLIILTREMIDRRDFADFFKAIDG